MDGRLFQRVRQSLGLTAAELAEKLSVSKVYISMIETNKRPVSELQELKIKALLRDAVVNGKDELFDLVFSIRDEQQDANTARNLLNFSHKVTNDFVN